MRGAPWLLWVSGVAALACADVEVVERAREAVVGEPSALGSVFRFEVEPGVAATSCTAVLVSPRVLLTAAHCVTGSFGVIDCGATPLGAVQSLALARVTNDADTTDAPDGSERYVSVAHASARAGELLCGHDYATLELEEAVDAEPFEGTREVPGSGVTLSIVGYGAGSPSGTGEGVRRVRGGLSLECSGAECLGRTFAGVAGGPTVDAPETASEEWIVSAGACPGDSGGAVMDDAGRLVGIVSRGFEDCGPSVVQPLGSDLRRLVRESARRVGDPVPDWAEEASSASGGASGRGGAPPEGGGPPAPSVGGEDDADDEAAGGCSMGSGGGRGGFLVGGALLLGLGMRRRAKGSALLAGALGALSLFGCAGIPRDSEGRNFERTCEKDVCVWREIGRPEIAYRADTSGRVLALCPEDSKSSAECRPLACESARDCGVVGGGDYGCDHGTCVAADRTLTPRDRVVLCQRGTGPYTGTALQRSRLTLAHACTGSCELPEECRR